MTCGRSQGLRGKSRGADEVSIQSRRSKEDERKGKSELFLLLLLCPFYLSLILRASAFSVFNDAVGDDIVRLIGINIHLPSGRAGCVLKPTRAPFPIVNQNGVAGFRVESAFDTGS